MNNAYLGGVCGGLGYFLGIDPLWVRVFFILLAFGNGVGILIYVLLWLIMPLEGQVAGASIRQNVKNGGREIREQTRLMHDDLRSAFQKPYTRLWTIFGSVLVVFGLFYLLETLRFSWTTWLRFELLWPLMLIFGGLALLLRRPKGNGRQAGERT
jgi:phage shock protein PspC (stress-responsive transcriptional regulator)